MATKISELPVGSITGAHRIPSIPTVGNTETITVDDIIALANAGFTLADLITMLASDVSGCLAALNAGVQSGAVWNTGTSTQDGVVSPAKIADAVTSQTAAYRALGTGGQVWVNVTGSRVVNTNYQNLSGRPIVALITVSSNSASMTSHYFDVSLDGSTWSNVCACSTLMNMNYVPVTLVVPNTRYYRYRCSGPSTAAPLLWWELR